MQEYWEIYMKNLEGKVASILFNAGISMEVENLKYIYPTIAYVKVKLKEPKSNGLLSKSEEDEIKYIEDKLEAALIKFRIGKYVGRVISNGYVTFLYYLQFTYNWQDMLNYALDEFESYEITTGFSEDSEWNYYNKLLFPNEKEWQIIQNHKACDALKLSGDNLEIPRVIEHKCFFKDESKKEELIKALNAQGFKIDKEIVNKEGVKGIKFFRTDKPFYYDIDELTLQLIDMLNKYNAVYDGWETRAVKD